MGRNKVEVLAVTLTGQRRPAFRLLTLLGDGPHTRQRILRKLKIDVRGFYRDLEALRGLGVDVLAATTTAMRWQSISTRHSRDSPSRPRSQLPRRPTARQGRDCGPPQAQAAYQFFSGNDNRTGFPEQAAIISSCSATRQLVHVMSLSQGSSSRHGGRIMHIAIIIPARFASTRLPGKPLLRRPAST